MKYDEEVLTSEGVLYATVSGELERAQFAALSKGSRQRAHDCGLRLLFDFTRATNFSPTPTFAHNWFVENYDRTDMYLKWVPTAHVHSPKDIEYFTFIETSWTNRGAIVRAFTDRAAALEWLGSIRTRTP